MSKSNVQLTQEQLEALNAIRVFLEGNKVEAQRAYLLQMYTSYMKSHDSDDQLDRECTTDSFEQINSLFVYLQTIEDTFGFEDPSDAIIMKMGPDADRKTGEA